MIGTYKYDDCIVIDPTVTLIDIHKLFSTDSTELVVYMEGENAGHVLEDTDGAEITLLDGGNMPPVTNEAALLSWSKNELQQYKV